MEIFQRNFIECYKNIHPNYIVQCKNTILSSIDSFNKSQVGSDMEDCLEELNDQFEHLFTLIK